MDKDGKALDMSDFGSVYIKYSSTGGQISASGDAMLNGYSGSFRGVYFNPILPDGEFRQYAVLPLWLFGDVSRMSNPSGARVAQSGLTALETPAPASSPREAWTRERVQQLIEPLAPALTQLGASLDVLAVDAPTAAVSCLGPLTCVHAASMPTHAADARANAPAHTRMHEWYTSLSGTQRREGLPSRGRLAGPPLLALVRWRGSHLMQCSAASPGYMISRRALHGATCLSLSCC